MGSSQMGGKAFLAIAAMVLAVIGVAALAAFFVSRDDATVPQQGSGPGVERASGAMPTVKPGNVTLLHSDERLTRALRALRDRTAGAPSAALVAAGQAVIVQQAPNQRAPVVALSATRELEASGPDDPKLESFVEYWLGRTR